MFKEFELYIWAAIAVVAVVGFSWYTHQQRDIGRQQIIAKDAEIVRAKEIHNAEVEARAGVLTEQALERYKATVSKPVANPHAVRVCLPAAPRNPNGVPADASASTGTDDPNRLSAALDRGAEEARADIGPYTETLLRDATARVKLQQDYINACIKEKICRSAK